MTTPIVLELLLQTYYLAVPPSLASEAKKEAFNHLLDAGAVTDDGKITKLGEAWVSELLSLPKPQVQIVGASGKVYPV